MVDESLFLRLMEELEVEEEIRFCTREHSHSSRETEVDYLEMFSMMVLDTSILRPISSGSA